MTEKISFVDPDTNEEVEFFVLEQTRINGTNYLLVTESDDEKEEETVAYIIKDLSKAEDSEALYEMVEDDNELESVSKIFDEILEDMDIE